MNEPSTQLDPLRSAAPLIVYIDFKSPYAYLAKDPTLALGDELGIEIDWRPFTLDIPSYLGSAKLDKEGRVAQSKRTDTQWKMVKGAYSDVRRYGSLRKAIIRGTIKIWDSSLAGIAMLWAKQQGIVVLHDYMRITYERFWKRELDIEDIAVLEGVLAEAGASVAGFREYASGTGRDLHDEIQRKSFDAGIFGVPTYLVDNEMYFGREHLPRIKWILTGRRGTPPDIAYEGGEPMPRAASIKTPLTFAFDFASPRSYLAVKPTCALADDLGIEVDWQPLVIEAPKKPKPATSTDNRGLRHRAIRAEYVERIRARHLADRGVKPKDSYADSTAAAIALLWLNREAKHLARRFTELTFERYWRGELNIEDESSLHRSLEEIGAPTTGGYDEFLKSEGRAALDETRAKLNDAGLIDVPTYFVRDEAFLGREHLPLIRNRLLASG